jgi:hypothetical protein
MTLEKLSTFRITCDGDKPNGDRCGCDIYIPNIESYSAAIKYAESFGWTHNAFGGQWRCNAGGGHEHQE